MVEGRGQIRAEGKGSFLVSKKDSQRQNSIQSREIQVASDLTINLVEKEG